MNRIYLVRHGENYANITKEFSYKLVDYDLTAKGIEQARQTAEYFSKLHIDEVYCSPLKRAVQTAQHITERTNTRYEIVEGFRELNVGDLEGKKPDASGWNTYFDVTHRWYSGDRDARFPNGEDFNELYARFTGGLEHIVKNKDGKNIVVVGHGGIFTACVLDLCAIQDREEFVNRQNHNCSISEILIDGTGVRLVRWADCAHVSGEAAQFMNGLPDK